MTQEEVKQYCLSLDGVTEATTNDNKWIVYCKDGNVFLLINKRAPVLYVTIKLPTDKGLKLQDEYNIVSPSYLNLPDWIDVDIENAFPSIQIQEWIKESYDLIMAEAKASENEKYVSLDKLLGIKRK